MASTIWQLPGHVTGPVSEGYSHEEIAMMRCMMLHGHTCAQGGFI